MIFAYQTISQKYSCKLQFAVVYNCKSFEIYRLQFFIFLNLITTLTENEYNKVTKIFSDTIENVKQNTYFSKKYVLPNSINTLNDKLKNSFLIIFIIKIISFRNSLVNDTEFKTNQKSLEKYNTFLSDIYYNYTWVKVPNITQPEKVPYLLKYLKYKQKYLSLKSKLNLIH